MYSVTSCSTAIHVIAKRPLAAVVLIVVATGVYYTAVRYSKIHIAAAQIVRVDTPAHGE